MKKYLLILVFSTFIGGGSFAQKANPGKDSLPVQNNLKYLDPSLPIEERINDLLPHLTLEEKIIQLSDSWGSKSIPRLKVPALLKTEGLHGQSYSTGATIFPHGIAMASTFNPELVTQVGKATAIESKAANLRASWSPVLDVARDVRWGRLEETYGEDPFLVSLMGVSWIRGFQGQNMIAIPKHFAGHGEPKGGRDSHDIGLSERTMRNYHLPPFRLAIKEAKAGGVMAAYGGWDGVPDNASGELLQKILREEWDFDGIVVSDCGGPEQFLSKHSIVASLEEASARAVLAGVDIECGSANVKALENAIRKGYIREADLDVNLRRVFRAKFKLGLFENPGPDKMNWEKLPAYDVPEHRALAREVAVQSIVLLKNNNLLPLSKSIRTIAVIGPNANEAQTGDYSGKASPGQVITVLQGIRSHVSTETKVLFAKGCDHDSPDSSGFAEAVSVAQQSDAIVLVAGDLSRPGGGKQTTGENIDGATLEIPGVQRQLIRAIRATGKPVVLVLVNGKPFTLVWENDNIDAILETWYPGEEGGNAAADIIFGDRNPSGRLPVTFPRHTGQLPLTYNYETSGRRYSYYDMPFTPLYRFGHGLSYTSFKYENLKITAKNDDPGFVTISADITNTGNRDGDEVAQLYITDVQATVITPVIELKGIRKVSLAKGEKKTVSFQLTPYDLSLLDINMLRTLEPGKFRVHVGGICPEPPQPRNDFHKQNIGFTDTKQGVTGEFTVPVKYAADFQTVVKLPATVKAGEPFNVTVAVKNTGNLLDMADVRLYGSELIDTRRFEIDRNETRTHSFSAILYKSGMQTVTVMLGNKVITKTVSVANAPARLVLQNGRSIVGTDGILHYTANASNTGSTVYKGKLEIRVDNAVVVSKPVQLEPGEKQDMALDYAFPRSGTFTVKAGQDASQQMVVPGGISLALQDPLISISFDQADGNSVKNAVTGQSLTIAGKPQWVAGKNGNGLRSGDKNTFVNAGHADIYRKPFSLAAWVNIDNADNGQAMFFGGQAPMGADVDITGTILAAGIQNNTLLFSFQNRDVKGATAVPSKKWTHLAFTYDPKTETGALYIDGKLDKSAPQKPFAGPLEMIGGATRFNHGNYIIDEVLVTRSCLSANAVKQLAANGIDALNNGEVTTQWNPSALITTLQTWTDIPQDSRIEVTIESADDAGTIKSTQLIVLKNGSQTATIEKPAGSQIRLRIKLVSGKWNALPVLQTAVLSGGGKSFRWASADEWMKTTVNGGVNLLK